MGTVRQRLAGVAQPPREQPEAALPADERYRLLPGVRVIRRFEGSIQIGTEPPEWVLIRRAPEWTAQFLRELDGSVPVATVLDRYGADRHVWLPLLEDLRRRRLLISAREWSERRASDGRETALGPPSTLAGELASLSLRYGPSTAHRILNARQDALIVIEGPEQLTTAMGWMLRTAGIGRIRRCTPAGAADSDSFGHHHPDLFILVGADFVLPWRVNALLAAGDAHLAVRIGLSGATVGPLTLPGRTCCPQCLLRHRADLDQGWPAVEWGAAEPPRSSSPGATVPGSWPALAAAVTEAVTLVDGMQQPSTVDATLEWCIGLLGPRRRRWSVHPDCDCRRR